MSVCVCESVCVCVCVCVCEQLIYMCQHTHTHISDCTIMEGCLKVTATVYKSHVPQQ